MDKQALLRALPSVESILADERVKIFSRALVRDLARQVLEETRQGILNGGKKPAEDVGLGIIQKLLHRLEQFLQSSYQPAINATGIILHTGLGRAVLAEEAIEAIRRNLGRYSLLQLDPETGKRSRRDGRIEELLRQLTGAEAATVVNNNAAATVLVLNSLAAGREVIVSRGQLIEIGGSFRLPEVMAAAGVKMVEVGTTNKTHPRDYENAINERTAAILRVHPSNFRVVGFTAEVGLGELVEIGKRHQLPVIDDLGAGALIDFSRFGFAADPTMADSLRTGADIVTSSADKLIGGPQGGIILGSRALVEKIRKNPWARVLRVDKLTLAALEATLMLFLDEQTALERVPTLQMLRRPIEELRQQADSMAAKLKEEKLPAKIEIIEGQSQMGSGSLPMQNLPTFLLAVQPEKISPDDLARRLRLHSPPIVARIQDERVVFDMRTMAPAEAEIVVDALRKTIVIAGQ